MVAVGWSYGPYSTPDFNLNGSNPLVKTCSLLKPRKCCSSVIQSLSFLLPQVFAHLPSTPGATNSLATEQISMAVARARTSSAQPNLALALGSVGARQGWGRWKNMPQTRSLGRENTLRRSQHQHLGGVFVLGCVAVHPGEVWWTAAALPGARIGAPESQTQGVSFLGKITCSLQYINQNKTWGAEFFQVFVPTRNFLSYLQLVHWRSWSYNNKYLSTCVKISFSFLILAVFSASLQER